MPIRGFRYRLYPSPEQEAQFQQYAGACRLIYNLALEQRQQFWRQFKSCTGKNISFYSQSAELTALRAEVPWLAAISYTAQQRALKDLDVAFSRFFAGKADYPQFRKRGGNDCFQFKGCEVPILRLNCKWATAQFPKIGRVKFRYTRDMPSEAKNVVVRLDRIGWHVSFSCETTIAPASLAASVGIDRGIANTVMLSTGEAFSLPRHLKKLDRRHKEMQRALSRRRKGSARRERQKLRCAKIAAKRARIRLDWAHKTSAAIASRFNAVTLEALQVVNMTAKGRGKRGLNRAIMDQGWGAFERILTYKVVERGGLIVRINPAYTSQTCSECGVVDRKSRESQAVYSCRHCGFTCQADHNAAINILRRNTASMRAEGRLKPPVETRTINPALAGGC